MRFVAIASLLALPLIATAQVYSWKDANGKMHYSDQPPADQAAKSRRLESAPAPEDSDTASQSWADKRQEAAKQAAEAKDKAAQTAKDKERDAIRQQNCERARQNLQGLESGQIRFRMGASGEREALDGDVREAELQNAQRAVDSNCNPPSKK